MKSISPSRFVIRMAGIVVLTGVVSHATWSADCDCPVADAPTPAPASNTSETSTTKETTVETDKDGKKITTGKTTTKTSSKKTLPDSSKKATTPPSPTPTRAPRATGDSEVQDQVTLFYFSDVQGLMKLLNPETRTENDVPDALNASRTARETLLTERGNMVKAQTLVNARQTALQKLLDSQKRLPQDRAEALERWKDTEKDVQSKERELQKREELLAAANDVLLASAGKVEIAKAAVDNATPESKKLTEAELLIAEKAKKSAEAAQKSAQARRDDAHCEWCFAKRVRDDAKRDYEKLRAALENLPEAITKAATELGEAQAQVETAKAATGRAMLTESAAFAEHRDNPVRLVATGDAGAVQPNLRVDLLAYKDARTIFLRGKRGDVDNVKDLIAKFDRPSPQARLALLTLQMTSKGGPSGAKRMNEAVHIIEEHLAATRSRMALVQGLLRDAINEEVNNQAMAEGMELLYGGTPDPAYMRRIVFYHPEVLRRLGLIENGAGRQHLNQLNTDLMLRLNEFVRVKQTANNSTDYAAFVTALKNNAAAFRRAMGMPGMPDYVDIRVAEIEGQLNLAQPNAVKAEEVLRELNHLLQRPGLTWVSALAPGMNNEDAFRTSFLKANLPDPAGTTTLGESLMVLSLAPRPTVAHVLESFEKKLEAAGLPRPVDPLKKDDDDDKTVRYPRTALRFAQLNAVLGAATSATTMTPAVKKSDMGLTPAQKEITLALQRVAIERVANLIQSNVLRLGSVAGTMQELSGSGKKGQSVEGLEAIELDAQWLRKYKSPHDPDLPQHKIMLGAVAVHESEATEVLKELMPVAEWLTQEYNLPLVDRKFLNVKFIVDFLVEKPHLFGSSASEGMIHNLLDSMSSLSAPEITNARIAAADEMLKRIIIAAEDDMDRNFVRPMMSDLEKQIRSKGVSVGVLQRTQVLATNRLIARTDPHGSGQLAMGKTTDAIAGLQGILDLAAIGSTGGAAGIAQGVLGVAKKQPPDQRPEYYGIETGGEFKLLPVIDPSGQALRFRFDYVLNSPVHEPKGTMHPQLPVLTQTTNTEVQLSNLEIRSIAEFNATVQLAQTGRHSGGIPLLNDLPLLRDIPVIGWFHYTRGRAAHVQKTMVVGQSTIYPTIGDISNLLTPVGPRRISEPPQPPAPRVLADIAQASAKKAKEAKTREDIDLAIRAAEIASEEADNFLKQAQEAFAAAVKTGNSTQISQTLTVASERSADAARAKRAVEEAKKAIKDPEKPADSKAGEAKANAPTANP